METSALRIFDIVPTHLAVKAMRDNGYKNAAYAVAELIDNSIQAEASVVELLCADEQTLIEQRKRNRLDQLAVLDNGTGMAADVLQAALQFGNGSRLDSGKHNGMGRFGMGLPSASISQCRRVEVWSWEQGPDEALYSYIDLDEVDDRRLDGVPVPVTKEIPKVWRQTASTEGFGDSGTLVVWSKIDRCMWRTSRALIDNSEELIGRMYRKWIDSQKVKIRMASFVVSRPDEMLQDKEALPNDPMYLMQRTSCPKPFDKKSMFRPYPDPEHFETIKTIKFQGKEHDVAIRFSIATEEARKEDLSGSLPYGQHARRNTGVSVVRAGRELELDLGWINAHDTRERWWGAEVSFEPGLDELFGVSNNKQFARNFAEAAKVDIKAMARDHGGSTSAVRRALEDEGDPIGPLIDVIDHVQKNIAKMRNIIGSQAEGRRRVRHGGATVEERGTEAIRRRKREGHEGKSDAQEQKSDKEREADLADGLGDYHDDDVATSLAAETITKGLKYRIETSSLEAGAFFSVQAKGGVLLVILNTDHPAYDMLLGASAPADLPDNPEELKTRLQAAQEGLELMLFAWARYEDEQKDQALRQAQLVRYDWGRMAESFLQSREDGQ